MCKDISLLFVFILIFIIPVYATKKTAVSKERAGQWIVQQRSLGFRENRGQMADMDGKPVPFVLFKAEVPNLNIWVTTTGLTYQFFKIEEDEQGRNNQESGAGTPEQFKEPVDERLKGAWHRVDMILKNGNIKKENIIAEDEINQGDISYYLGHCSSGIFKVKTYTKIIIKEIYPGIDWVLYTSSNEGNKGNGAGDLKHDFIVHPYADPGQIKLIYEGSGNLEVKNNQIHFENELGEVSEGKLICYQKNELNIIASNYSIKKSGNEIKKGFSYELKIETGMYDTSKILIIDPKLWWASFYGGNNVDGTQSITCDAAGNIYVTGYTGSVNFPLKNLTGAYYDNTFGGNIDAFILCFTNAGVPTWATYYGGSFFDCGYSIALDGANNIYLTGATSSANFPVQNSGGAYNDNTQNGSEDIFILKFDNFGIRQWATFYGGADTDRGRSIVCDGANNVYITGETFSTNFPLQNFAGAYNQISKAAGGGFDVFILRFNNLGQCIWATYYGGNSTELSYSISIDGLNNIYITGYTSSTNLPTRTWGNYNQTLFGGGFWDAFILRFDNSGVLSWATYYGGSETDSGQTIACDVANNIYVLGETASANFPIQNWPGAYNQSLFGGLTLWFGGKWFGDAFLLRFTSTGIRTWSTYYGGSANEIVNSHDNITFDANCGNIYISIGSVSNNIFTSGNTTCGAYYDPGLNGGTTYGDQFIIKFNNAGAVIWATYLGGNGEDFYAQIVADNNGNLFTTGEWNGNAGYPLVNPAGGVQFDNSQNGSDDINITKFIPLTPIITQSQVNGTNCGCMGTATVNISCGETNYSYVWSNGNQTLNTTGTTNNISGLCPGTYTVTVTDGACRAIPYTASFTIVGGSNSNVNLTIAITDESCGLNDGTASANPTGGIAPYTYLWNNSQTAQTATGLAAGNYTVTLTDSNGCSAIAIATVVSPVSLAGEFTKGTAGCTGCGCKEWILVTAKGGTGPYSYIWNDGYSKRYKNQLCPGNYTVNIKDKNGCSINVNLTAP